MAGETRKPDGVALKPGFHEEPDKGPALSRPVTDGAALNSVVLPGEKFAAGLGALEGKDDADKVTLCNLSMRTLRFSKVAGPQAHGKRGLVDVVLEAFGLFETTVEHARRLLLSQEHQPRGRRPIPALVVVGNYRGDCGGKRKFTAHGRTFGACPFHGCSHADHADNPWSVFQAQHYLRMLGTPNAIDRFTTSFDLRLDVVALAIYERRGREDAHRRQQEAAAKGASQHEAVW